MAWQEEWKAVSARVDGLVTAANIFLAQKETDYFGVSGSYFFPQVREVLNLLRQMFTNHQEIIPPTAIARFKEFEDKHKKMFDTNAALRGLSGQISVIAGIRAELQYLLSDFDVRARSLTERAFTHLQRLLVTDSEVAAKWQAAFDNHETHCERLGGVHLLHHGLWAFKVDAVTGGRTDLVLGTALASLDEPRRVAEGLVLTEWKRVMDFRKANDAANDAFNQAELYAAGILAGFELASTRYIVLVSGDVLPHRPDRAGKIATYRHVNVAVCATPPSVAAKKMST